MLFNPLFVQIGVGTNPIEVQKSTKLNNTSYLFSDIIRVISDSNKSTDPLASALMSKTAGSNTALQGGLPANFNSDSPAIQAADSNTSQNTLNINDLLKELLANIQSGKGETIASLESDLAKAGDKNIHLLTSEGDLDGFLKNLFNALPELKMVAGGDKNFIVKPVSGKTGEDNQDQKKQVEDAIVNLLQTNNNIILNFNLGKEQFKIEIQKIAGSSNGTNTDPASSVDLNVLTSEATQSVNKNPAVNDTQNPVEVSQSAADAVKGSEDLIKGAAGKDAAVKTTGAGQTGKQATEKIVGKITETFDIGNVKIKPAVEENVGGKTTPLDASDNGTTFSGPVTSSSKSVDIKSSTAAQEITNAAGKTAPDIIKIIPAAGTEKAESSSATVNNKIQNQTESQVTTQSQFEELLSNIPDQKTKILADAKASIKNADGSAANTGSKAVNTDGQKYILSIKVNSPQVKTGGQNLSLQNNAVTEKGDIPDPQAAGKNINIDLTSLSAAKTAEDPVQLLADRGAAAGKELFNPPLTLKLSMKQQIRNVEKNGPDGAKLILDNSGDNNKTAAIKADTAPAQNNLNAEAGINKTGSQTTQILNDNVQTAAEINTGSIISDPKKGTDTVNSELAGTINKDAGTTQKVKENNSNTVVKQAGQNSGEAENPVLSAENSGGDLSGKSGDEKQKNTDMKTSAPQSVNDFEKLVTLKDKITDKPAQLPSTPKTINASDIAKEFTSIINQKDSKSVVLQLSPEKLGKIKLSIDVTNNIVHARVEVENEAVKQMVQANLDALKHSLNLNGLQLSTLDVSLSGGQQKSFKSYGTRKKFNYSGNSAKISEEPESMASRNMGYNTYEYLI